MTLNGPTNDLGLNWPDQSYTCKTIRSPSGLRSLGPTSFRIHAYTSEIQILKSRPQLESEPLTHGRNLVGDTGDVSPPLF